MVSKRSDEAEAPASVAATGGAGRKPRTKRGGAEPGRRYPGPSSTRRSNVAQISEGARRTGELNGVAAAAVCVANGFIEAQAEPYRNSNRGRGDEHRD